MKSNNNVNLSTYAIENLVFDEYREKVNNVFHGVNRGVLTQPISPAILLAEDLEYFVNNNPIFANSIYATNSKLLLRAGD